MVWEMYQAILGRNCVHVCNFMDLLDFNTEAGGDCHIKFSEIFGFVSDFFLHARLLCYYVLKCIGDFFASLLTILFNLFPLFLSGLAVWRWGSTCFYSPSVYSCAWYCGWPMCSNFSFYCHWALVCGNQGGYFLLLILFPFQYFFRRFVLVTSRQIFLPCKV